jgi:hypothetical protein
MKKYIVTYHAPAELLKQSQNATPEEMEKGMEAWYGWAKKCGDKLIDLGNPLVNGQTLKPNGNSENSTHGVCGYSILQAENMEEAKKLLEGHPHLMWDSSCEIEVHESMPLPGS